MKPKILVVLLGMCLLPLVACGEISSSGSLSESSEIPSSSEIESSSESSSEISSESSESSSSETAIYPVTFTSEGFTDVVVNVLDGATVTAPEGFTKDYYVLSGWTLDGVAFDFNTPITGPITLVASWSLALSLQGTGTEADPFLLNTAADLDLLRSYPVDVTNGNYFKFAADINYSISGDLVSIFAGHLVGNAQMLTILGDQPLFTTLAETSTVDGLIINPAIASETRAKVASLAMENYGHISNIGLVVTTHEEQRTNPETSVVETVTVTVGSVISTAGTVNDLATADASGAAGLVGINQASGVISSSVSAITVQAKIGSGAFASVNLGRIENCTNNGLIGATATTVSSSTGAAVATYSYAGGIAGFNSGTIDQCVNNNNVFAQRNAKTAASNGNEFLGGIVGYNQATGIIEESINMGRIHGDRAIGGIAGSSDGIIRYSYNVGDYGGRFDLGGIAGLMVATATVSYCFSTTSYNSTSSTNSYKYSDAQLTGNYWALSQYADHSVYTDINVTSTLAIRDGAAPASGEGNVAMSVVASTDFTSVLGTEYYVYNAATTPNTMLIWYAATLA